MDDAKMVESLVLIFKVGLSLFGRDYPKDDLTPNQHSFLKHLNAVGLTYQRKTGGARYYPTSSAVLLMQPERGGVGGSPTGHLITETNFRVYAHQPTVVQEALLSKFIELVRRDFAHACSICGVIPVRYSVSHSVPGVNISMPLVLKVAVLSVRVPLPLSPPPCPCSCFASRL
jgi:hypothetical protein